MVILMTKRGCPQPGRLTDRLLAGLSKPSDAAGWADARYTYERRCGFFK
jgi:hypothetical protein